MENGPFIDDVPINTSIYKGFSMAMLNDQMVIWLSSFCLFNFSGYLLDICLIYHFVQEKDKGAKSGNIDGGICETSL